MVLGTIIYFIALFVFVCSISLRFDISGVKYFML